MFRNLNPDLLAALTVFHLSFIQSGTCWCGREKESVDCRKKAHHLYHSGEELKAAMKKSLAMYGHNPENPGVQQLVNKLLPERKVETFVWWNKRLNQKADALAEIISKALPEQAKSA